MTQTPISAWVTEDEELPIGGRNYRVRSVDVLSVLNDDGGIPNMMLPLIQQLMKIEQPKPKDEPTAKTPEEGKKQLEELTNTLNKITKAVLTYPPLVDDMEAVKRGEGVMLHHIPLDHKVSIMSWAMGGKAAMQASEKFLNESRRNVVTLPSSNVVPQKPKRGRRTAG
jgi:hypothetical protein